MNTELRKNEKSSSKMKIIQIYCLFLQDNYKNGIKMVLEIRLENFFSINEEVVLDMPRR